MVNKGTLYWITGLSGAGKTTIGNRLYYKMKSTRSNTIILDGDILRKITGNDLGYSKEDRLERAYRYNALCKLLTDQGINVIICTIAMFDEVREWNRKNIENYIEVFLDVELEVLIKRNRKGLYSKKGGSIVGVDIEAEYPKTPDIVIKNNGRESLEKDVQRILNYQAVSSKGYNSAQEYWDRYYTELGIGDNGFILKESSFAHMTFQKYMEPGKDLIELGCGNGGDSVYFAKNGINVLGIDSSKIAIKQLQDDIHLDNCTLICEDFVNAETIYQTQYDYCYSRCTLSEITEQQEMQLFDKVSYMLKEKGYFFIETWSVHDGKYGLGKKIEKNTYIYEGHFRRYIDLKELEEKLKKIGFSVVFKEESEQLISEENTVCIRMVAKKA